MRRKIPFVLAVALLSLARSAQGLSPDADKLILKGLNAAYGFNFSSAAVFFAEADRLAPEHPAGPFFLASLKWLEYSQDVDVPGTEQALEPQFNKLMDEALRRAEKMYAKNHKDPDATFYLGGIYGMKGRWLLLKRKWFRAAHYGFKGYKYLKKTVALDPNYYDAYLGMGMYDYYSDTLPGVMKFAANLIVRGDKARGLRYVTMTLDKGHYSSAEAKLFLIGLLNTYEHQPERALTLVEEMRLERPDNLFYVLMEVGTRINMKDWPGAIAFGEYLIPRIQDVPYAIPHASVFQLYLGEAYMGAKDYTRALETLTACIEQAPEPRKASVTYCHLRRAQAYDLLGRRDAAVADYAFVKARPDYFDSEDKARHGLKSPVTYDEVLKQLLE